LIDSWAKKEQDDSRRAILRERIRRFAFTRRSKTRGIKNDTKDRARDAYTVLTPHDAVIRHQCLFTAHWVEESSDEHKRAICSAAYALLGKIKRIPGTSDDDNMIKAADLKAWLIEVRSLCLEYGRAKIGDQQIGRILAAAPVGDDGDRKSLRYRDLRTKAYRPRRNHWVSSSRYESGGETFVAVMQAADLRDGDDSSDPGWLDRSRVRAILAERKMRASSLVVVYV
jgi:hypothetical protein